MKKLISMLLIVAMAATLMIGCGGDDSQSVDNESAGNSEENSSNEGDNQAASDEEPYEIVVELIGSGVAQPDTALVEEEINKITLPAINCTVKFREITIADHATQLSLLGTDGDKLDIVFVGYTTSMNDLVANGLLVGLGDLLDKNAPEMLEKAGVLMEACKVGDEYYCVPGNYYPAVEDAVAYLVDVVEENNIEIPENPEGTYEYLEKFFENVKASGFDGYPTTYGVGDNANIVGKRMEQFGANLLSVGVYGVLMDMNKDIEIVNVYDTEEYLQECLKHKEWRDKGYIVPDSMTNGDTLFGAVMAKKICGSITRANVSFLPSTKQMTGQKMKGIPFSDTYLTGASIPEYGLGVTVTSEKPEKAVQLLNLIMTNSELANLMNYGIEGKHYEKVSDHIIKYPEGIDASNVGYGIQIVSFGDSADVYKREPFTEEWFETLDEYSAENSDLSQAFGYTFDISPVRTQVSAVSSVIQEYNPSLICGMNEERKQINYTVVCVSEFAHKHNVSTNLDKIKVIYIHAYLIPGVTSLRIHRPTGRHLLW